jgi:hypothetical protein
MHSVPALGPLATPATAAAPAPLVVAAAPAAAAAVPEPSPRMRLDPALGLVVLEFRDARGEITQTLPSARQLAAYRIAPPHR